MAQLVVRNIEDSLKARIQRRAKRNGRSMEDEVRHILRDAGKESKESDVGLGTQISELFRGIGTKLERLPRELPKPAKFK